MDSIDVKALAKINIGLDVTGIRDDGYHEVRMIMQTVNLFDKLTVKKVKDGSVTMSTNLKFLPVDDDNLCIKAAKLLIDEFGIKEGVEMCLQEFLKNPSFLQINIKEQALFDRVSKEVYSKEVFGDVKSYVVYLIYRFCVGIEYFDLIRSKLGHFIKKKYS